MKKIILTLGLVGISASPSLAQQDFETEFRRAHEEYQAQQQQKKTGNIYILNQPANSGVQGPIDASAKSAMAAPTVAANSQSTVQVVDSALTGSSRAEQLRRSRQQLEITTEEKIVERLEAARMEDEQRRIEQLFGGANKAQSQIQTQQQVAPVQVVSGNDNTIITSAAQESKAEVQQVVKESVVAPVVIEETSDKRRTNRRVEERFEDDFEDVDYAEERTSLRKIRSKQQTRNYIAPIGGLTEYPDVVNIRGNYSLGVALGAEMDGGLVVEGSFLYSNYDIEINNFAYGPQAYYPGYYSAIFQNLDQYSVQGAFKYRFLQNSQIKPLAGALLGYSYRKFSDMNSGYYSYYNSSNSDTTSHSFDFGLLAGVDFELSHSFSIGFDFRYLMNVYSRTYSQYPVSFINPPPGSTSTLEEESYYMFLINTKFAF